MRLLSIGLSAGETVPDALRHSFLLVFATAAPPESSR
jgi:hypothetical protein